MARPKVCGFPHPGHAATVAAIWKGRTKVEQVGVNFGGYSETGGLTRYTRLDNPDLLRSVAYPRGEGERDDANGTIVYPKHVHKALRRYLGLENSPGARRFPFAAAEDFAFFG